MGGVELPETIPMGTEFFVEQVVKEAAEGGVRGGALLGRHGDTWAMLYSPNRAPFAERVLKGWNETPRKPIKGQSGHQMMLVSDMVLRWDHKFRIHLETYAKDEEKLKEDFGNAFQRLTE